MGRNKEEIIILLLRYVIRQQAGIAYDLEELKKNSANSAEILALSKRLGRSTDSLSNAVRENQLPDGKS